MTEPRTKATAPPRQRRGGDRTAARTAPTAPVASAARPAPTTRPRASRSSRASRPSDAGPACTSARPMSVACTTSSGRSSTTRSTRRWPATPRTSGSRSQPDGLVEVIDDGRGIPVGKHATGKDALEVVHTVLHAGGKFGGGGYKVSGGLHGVGVSVVNALSEWLAVESARDGERLGARSTSAASRIGPVKRIGPQGDRRGTRTRFRADPEMFETIEYSFDTISQRLRESAYLTKGVWITFIDQRGGSRAVVLLRGRPPVVRAPPQPEQGGAPQPPDLRRAPRGRDPGRGRAPVQRHLHGERARLRQQHQHGRRRHPRHGLPGRARRAR